METYFRQGKKLAYEHNSAGTVVKFVYCLQSGPTFMWIIVALKKFEGVVLCIVVDNAHDLLSCHSLLFTHRLAWG